MGRRGNGESCKTVRSLFVGLLESGIYAIERCDVPEVAPRPFAAERVRLWAPSVVFTDRRVDEFVDEPDDCSGDTDDQQSDNDGTHLDLHESDDFVRDLGND